ncbi:MAG: ISKra4 family transposase, partial [Chloroflexi bacterium]|nr:ISKra4 family transposase [Chloroflexota bacterium]
MSGYAQEAVEGFERSRVRFEQIVAGLAAAEAGEQTHAQLEEHLAGEGRELLRQLLQDHLDLRAVRERRAPQVVGADQVAHTRVEPDHRRGLVTVFGQVTVARMAYRAPGVPNLYPADEWLNLPGGLHSLGLRKLAAAESVRGSFETAA